MPAYSGFCLLKIGHIHTKMADNALLIVERVLGTPASKTELDEAHIHLGSTCRTMAERAKKESWLGSTPEQQVQVGSGAWRLDRLLQSGHLSPS